MKRYGKKNFFINYEKRIEKYSIREKMEWDKKVKKNIYV